MTPREHLLTIVEPTIGGDATLDLAEDTVARGGTAKVVMIITDRVQRDIRDFAAAEDLAWNDAQSQALDRLRSFYAARTGAISVFVTAAGQLDEQLRGHVTPDTTAIAIQEQLLANFSVQAFTKATGIPVIVAPSKIERLPARKTLASTAA